MDSFFWLFSLQEPISGRVCSKAAENLPPPCWQLLGLSECHSCSQELSVPPRADSATEQHTSSFKCLLSPFQDFLLLLLLLLPCLPPSSILTSQPLRFLWMQHLFTCAVNLCSKGKHQGMIEGRLWPLWGILIQSHATGSLVWAVIKCIWCFLYSLR